MSTMAMMTTTTTKISQRRPRIVLFGDSLTEFSFGGDFGGTTRSGWGSLLAQAFVRKADVYNRGYSGYTTTMAVETALPTLFVDRTKSNNNSNSSNQQEAPMMRCYHRGRTVIADGNTSHCVRMWKTYAGSLTRYGTRPPPVLLF